MRNSHCDMSYGLMGLTMGSGVVGVDELWDSSEAENDAADVDLVILEWKIYHELSKT